jgi:hypothetical protein
MFGYVNIGICKHKKSWAIRGPSYQPIESLIKAIKILLENNYFTFPMYNFEENRKYV